MQLLTLKKVLSDKHATQPIFYATSLLLYPLKTPKSKTEKESMKWANLKQ